MAPDSPDSSRFRSIFERLHRHHPRCLEDEWLGETCRAESGEAEARPIVWSRRNGPWRRCEVLWIGAAPGNAGGRGSGDLGAHGTLIPFGGDIGGANLDVLLSSIGLDRNRTFLCSASNRLPASGGGEPRVSELASPEGGYPDSIAVLRDTLLAVGPRLVVALGNVALRSTFAAAAPPDGALRLPSLARLERAGLSRGRALAWPEAEPPDPAFLTAWRDAWGESQLPALLWLIHPSAQNMSPYAGVETGFHRRMVETQAALRAATESVLGRPPPRPRPRPPRDGIYALPEWSERIRPRHEELDRLWREKGV